MIRENPIYFLSAFMIAALVLFIIGYRKGKKTRTVFWGISCLLVAACLYSVIRMNSVQTLNTAEDISLIRLSSITDWIDATVQQQNESSGDTAASNDFRETANIAAMDATFNDTDFVSLRFTLLSQEQSGNYETNYQINQEKTIFPSPKVLTPESILLNQVISLNQLETILDFTESNSFYQDLGISVQDILRVSYNGKALFAEIMVSENAYYLVDGSLLPSAEMQASPDQTFLALLVETTGQMYDIYF